MDQILELLDKDPDMIIPLVAVSAAIVCGTVIALVSIVTSYVAGVHRARDFEKSRREIAAYVSEGSMSPADADRLLKAAPPQSE